MTGPQEWFDVPVPEVRAVRRRLEDAGLSAGVTRATLAHLAAPATTVARLAADTSASLEEVDRAYEFLRHTRSVRTFVASAFYPHRLWTAAAESMVSSWLAAPARPERLLAGASIAPDTVEIHPSRGTCAYGCAMCLWSDKDALTYASRELQADGLVTTEQWTLVLRQLRDLGARNLVVSGGGEALLNPDLPAILTTACDLGFVVSLYASGFNLDSHRGVLWEPVVNLSKVRLSIHSPDPATYARIVRLPERLCALERVTGHLRTLLALRQARATRLTVGIGFVLQPDNYDQVELMVDYATDAGADFLDLRKDEVEVTEGLTSSQLGEAAEQLRRVRQRAQRGFYGRLDVDLGDELVALANGQPVIRSRTSECRIKYLRPTISPYGVLTPCDLKAEPRFAHAAFNLGVVTRQPIDDLVAGLPRQFVPDACAQCMPSSRTGNGVADKLLTDLRHGWPLARQPFAAPARSTPAGAIR